MQTEDNISLNLLKMIKYSNESSRENQNTHFMVNNFFSVSCRLCDNVERQGRARQVADDNILRPSALHSG